MHVPLLLFYLLIGEYLLLSLDYVVQLDFFCLVSGFHQFFLSRAAVFRIGMACSETDETARLAALCTQLGRLNTEHQIEDWDDNPSPKTPPSQIQNPPHLSLPRHMAADNSTNPVPQVALQVMDPAQRPAKEAIEQDTSIHTALVPYALLS